MSLSTAPAKAKIVYTLTDEAPLLAAYAFLPIVNRFLAPAGIPLETSDISLAARVLAQFADMLPEDQRVPDDLANLGVVCKSPDALVIKTPNISASLAQLENCIEELQAKGYAIPSYPASPLTAEEREIQARYQRTIGSAVNPVLREGNSDRRVADPVKAYARANPAKMAEWKPDCLTHVASMEEGDFYGSELSVTVEEDATFSIKLDDDVLKAGVEVLAGDVVDAATMNVRKLRAYYAREMEEAKQSNLLVSLHLKATMMRVSDPIMFSHAIQVYFADMFDKFGDELKAAGANPAKGWASVLSVIDNMPSKDAIMSAVDGCMERRADLAMVDSNRGITNLHYPNDIIVDASMPTVCVSGGHMWNKHDKLQATVCLIPDRSYGCIYDEVFSFLKTHGQFNQATMGNVANVGLMAQKAEEYGSHDTTFEMPRAGVVRVVNDKTGAVVFEHAVEEGDIWRMCQTHDVPIQNWVELAVARARATMDPTIFWLDPDRAHDAQLIQKVGQAARTPDPAATP